MQKKAMQSEWAKKEHREYAKDILDKVCIRVEGTRATINRHATMGYRSTYSGEQKYLYNIYNNIAKEP